MKLGQKRIDVNSHYYVKNYEWNTKQDNRIVKNENEILNNTKNITKNSSNISKIDTRVTNLEKGGNSGIVFKNATVYYNIIPWDAGTGTQNECQSFVDGKFFPINVIPFELSTSTWRTYYITNWLYIAPTTDHPNGQTQVLYYASDPQSPIDLVGFQCD